MPIDRMLPSCLAVGLALISCRGGGGFPERACSAETFSLVDAMRPAFAYAELRESTGEKSVPRVVGASGEKCKGAKDMASCTTHLEEATTTAGFANGSHGRMPGFRYLVVTRDDEVIVIDGHARTVGAALAPIDTPEKAAAAAASARNITPSCGGSVRRIGGGFEVHLASDSCFGPVDEVVRVGNDGAVNVVTSERKPATCVGDNGNSSAPQKGRS